MASWARVGEELGGPAPARRLSVLIPAAVVVMALVFGVIFGRITAPQRQLVVRTMPLAPGSTQVESNVPVGYQRTQQGAVDAATNYAVALNGPVPYNADDLRAAVDVAATAEYRTDLEASTARDLQGLNSYYGIDVHAQAGARPVIKLVPIAYHLDAYSPAEASVGIWAVWLIAEEGLLVPQQHWTTTHIALKWQGGDWKISATGAHPGPIPQPVQGAVPESSTPLPAALTDYQEYTHVAP